MNLSELIERTRWLPEDTEILMENEGGSLGRVDDAIITDDVIVLTSSWYSLDNIVMVDTGGEA